MIYGSLFSGIGGGDLGLGRAGMTCAWQVEKDRQCRAVLESHWPAIRRYEDVREFPPAEGCARVDLIIGGDPCPCRSKARGSQGAKSPDLFPEFLRVVSLVRPAWVLRENVVARDTQDCARALVRLGYNTVVLHVDSAGVTGQSRPREYLCGVLAAPGICPVAVLRERTRMAGDHASVEEAQTTSPCLSTHPRRFDSRDGLICDALAARSGKSVSQETFIRESGLRILAPVERERLQGFPDGWTDGHSFTARCRMLGNAMTVPVVEWIGRRIVEAK